MEDWVFWWEAMKVLAPIVAALVIARLTVRWALSRYKAEKIWERQLSAYVDVIAALSEMRQITSTWYDDCLFSRDRSDESAREQNRQYREAKRRLNEAVATARLLLKQPAQNRLAKLQIELEQNEFSSESLQEKLDHDVGALGSALEDLVENGRTALAFYSA